MKSQITNQALEKESFSYIERLSNIDHRSDRHWLNMTIYSLVVDGNLIRRMPTTGYNYSPPVSTSFLLVLLDLTERDCLAFITGDEHMRDFSSFK